MSRFPLIAPSGYCINQQAALRGLARLTEAGHQVDNSAVIARRCQRFAGTEAERLADVNALVNLNTPDTIVMAVRGGYGASRLLADIDWQALANRQQHNPLLLCGHSDFTAIQCGLLAQGNVISFSGPMLAANFGAEEMNAFTEHHFWQAVRNAQFTLEWQGNGPACATEGTLLTSILFALNACCCNCITQEYWPDKTPLSSAVLAAAHLMITTRVTILTQFVIFYAPGYRFR